MSVTVEDRITTQFAGICIPSRGHGRPLLIKKMIKWGGRRGGAPWSGGKSIKKGTGENISIDRKEGGEDRKRREKN